MNYKNFFSWYSKHAKNIFEIREIISIFEAELFLPDAYKNTCSGISSLLILYKGITDR